MNSQASESKQASFGPSEAWSLHWKTAQYSTLLLYCTVLYTAVLFCTVRCCAVHLLYTPVMHSTTLY